ncbi:MAG: folate family ECF transporter S component [Clostridiales Family XIII bacterium]|jgi:ECF transporter S component (folate family)|nr:folate family ECF transporter S component [Clostridiales Family XIII bacterium]
MFKNGKLQLSSLVIIAFLIALEVVLSRMVSINTPVIRISFAFVPVAMMGIMYGPLWAAGAYALGDVIGALLFPTGAFFPGFTLTAALTGLTYGFFLHGRDVTWRRVLPASFIVCALLNFGLDTLWVYIITGKGVAPLIPVRLTKAAVMIPLQTLLVPLLWKQLRRVTPLVRQV